jgi:hypothetical protein
VEVIGLEEKKMKMLACPCGWTVKSPWGENDVVEHAMLHLKRQHPDQANTKKEDVAKMVQDA